MSRIATIACLALALPVLSAAQSDDASRSGRSTKPEAFATGPGADVDPEACRTDAQAAEPQDPQWQWRLRAFRHLDCVVALADRALTAARPAGRESGTGAGRPQTRANDQVMVSRADLERMRTLAWWARDAAARIGQ